MMLCSKIAKIRGCPKIQWCQAPLAPVLAQALSYSHAAIQFWEGVENIGHRQILIGKQ